jgi:general stress protein YciG
MGVDRPRLLGDEETMSEKALRGLATLTPEKRRAIASMGGKALSPEQRSFSQDRALASAAGKLGGRGRRQSPPLHET